jgi:hypothetical protein
MSDKTDKAEKTDKADVPRETAPPADEATLRGRTLHVSESRRDKKDKSDADLAAEQSRLSEDAGTMPRPEREADKSTDEVDPKDAPRSVKIGHVDLPRDE